MAGLAFSVISSEIEREMATATIAKMSGGNKMETIPSILRAIGQRAAELEFGLARICDQIETPEGEGGDAMAKTPSSAFQHLWFINSSLTTGIRYMNKILGWLELPDAGIQKMAAAHYVNEGPRATVEPPESLIGLTNVLSQHANILLQGIGSIYARLTGEGETEEATKPSEDLVGHLKYVLSDLEAADHRLAKVKAWFEVA